MKRKRYREKRYQRGGAGEDTTVPGDNPGYVGNTYAYGNTVPGSGLWGDPTYITALFSFPEKNKTRVVIQSEQSRRYFTDVEVEFDLVNEDGEHLKIVYTEIDKNRIMANNKATLLGMKYDTENDIIIGTFKSARTIIFLLFI